MARIPAVKENTGIPAGLFGTVLTVCVVGTLLSMQVAGPLIARLGSRTVIRWGVPLMAAGLWGVSSAKGAVQLGATLLLFGLADGLVTVGINVQGVTVEKLTGRPCLNSCHASWSVGALVGALLGGGATWAGWGTGAHFLAVGALTTLASYPVLRGLAAPGAPAAASMPASGPVSARRGGWSGRVLALGGLGLCCLVAQGALQDWGALFLREERGASPFAATLGYLAFCTTLTLGRMAGDRLRARFRPATVVRLFALTAVLGLAVSLTASSQASTIGGFAVFGWGLSILDPVINSAAGHGAGDGGREETTSTAIAHVATLGHVGLLLGPPLIGWLTELVGIGWALVLPGVAVCAVGLAAAYIARAFAPSAVEGSASLEDSARADGTPPVGDSPSV
ncbi:MFS transporter [Streptomyces sp. MST-110588]|nr:MFS transporter [Streptomyces sp. MST-110588]